MKKILSLVFWLLLIGNAVAQTVFTDYRDLALPPAAPGTWGEQYNNNFRELDATKIPRVTVATLPLNPAADTLVVVTNALNGTTCTSAAGTAQNICQWNGATWIVVGGSSSGGGGVGHTIQDEASVLPARGNLNFVGGGVTCVDNGAQNRTDCTVPAGSTDQTATYTWTGPHSWRDANFSLLDNTDTSKIAKFELGGQTSATTRTYSMPDASTRLLGDSDFSATGVMARTGSNTYAGRTLQSGNAGYLAWTNPAGIAGDPSINIGANVVATDRANTYTAGSKQIFTPSATTSGFNLGALAGDPSSPANGDVWYNSSTNKFRKRENGSTTDLDTTGGSVAFSAVTAGTNVNALLIGNAGSLNSTGTGTITANRTPCTGTQYLVFDGTCASATATADQTAAYTWTGAHTWRDNNWSLLDNGDTSKILKFDIANFTTANTRTMTLPDASTRLIGDSDFAATGMMARTAANTYAGRTLGITAGSTNYLAWTNGNGVSGAPTIGLGANVMATDRDSTITSGNFDFSLATSFTVKKATGYAPTASGLWGYDTTANRFVGGVNGVTRTFAFTSEIQPLSSNLTALSGLTGASGSIPYFTGVGAMGTSALLSCPDTGGNHLNVSSLSPLTFVCGTSSTAGLSGLTVNKYLRAASATTADTSGSLSETGGVVSMSGMSVGSGIKGIFDFSGLSASDKTFIFTNFSGTVRTSTGAITAGHVITVDANGQLIDGGAAGSGTWTDSSTNTGTNKTLVATQAGGTNTITTGFRAVWDSGSLTIPSASTCTAPALTQINSGPSAYTISCTDASTSTFEGQIQLTQAVTTVTFTLTVNDVDSSSQHFAGDFSAMCRNNNTTVNNTWGTSQSVDITMTTAQNNYTGTTSAVTPNGTCSSGATLFWRFVVNTTPFTDDGDARVINVAMAQAS